MNEISLADRMRQYLSNQRGGVAIIFAVCAVAIIAFAGAAIDLSQAQRTRTLLQVSLDAAVLAGVASSNDPDEQIDTAENHFEVTKPEGLQIDNVSFAEQDGMLVGTLTAEVQTAMMGIIGIHEVELNVSSTAESSFVREELCFMAMHPSRKHTLELKGTVSVTAPDCHVYGNSDHPNDVVDPHGPENFLTGKSVQAIGYGHHYLQNVSPPLEYAPELIADPLATRTIPSPGGCDYTNTKVDGVTVTLDPGAYCGGLELKNGANVTLNPGLYALTGGKFKVDDAALNGEEVTISLSTPNLEIDWKDAQIQLSAPKTGEYAGIVIMGVRQDEDHTMEDSVIDLHGTVYLPNGTFEWINDGNSPITAMWTAWIVDGVTWEGNGEIFINFDYKNSDVPLPTELMAVIPIGNPPRLVF